MLKVKIKKLHPDAVIPKYAKVGDAGMDLTAVSKEIDEDMAFVYKTGLSIEIPEGYIGLLFPRSSISKYNLLLTNSVGVIDSGYRGEIILKFTSDTAYYEEDAEYYDYIYKRDLEKEVKLKQYKVGDRVGQIIILPYPQIEFEEVSELSETERGLGGFGSTGK